MTTNTKVKLKSFQVEVKERTDYDYRITVNGKRYDAADLYETLEAVIDGDVYIDNAYVGMMLLDNKVLKSLGSQRWCSGATPGENFHEFRNALRAGLEEAGFFEY